MIQQPWGRLIPGRFVGDVKLFIDIADITQYVSVSTQLYELAWLFSTASISSAVSALRELSDAINSAVNVSSQMMPTRVLDALANSIVNAQTSASAKGEFIIVALSAVNIPTSFSAAHSLLVGGVITQRPGIDRTAVTWVCNTETGATSQYDDYGFNSFATTGTEYLGVCEDGIYRLDGNDDAGIPIGSLCEMPQRSFGTARLKRIPNIWIGAEASGPVVLKVVADDQTYYYTAKDSGVDPDSCRVDLGRGIRARYWTFSLIDTAPEWIESIEFKPVLLDRRI